MKYFINPKDNLPYGYEADGSQDHLIAKDMVPIDVADIPAHVASNTPPEAKAENARMTRDSLLMQSDWTQLPDVPGTTKAKWAEYRQALRDITAQKTFPESVVWPTSP